MRAYKPYNPTTRGIEGGVECVVFRVGSCWNDVCNDRRVDRITIIGIPETYEHEALDSGKAVVIMDVRESAERSVL